MEKGFSKLVIKSENQFFTFKGFALLDKKDKPVKIEYQHQNQTYSKIDLVNELFPNKKIEIVKEITGK